MASRVPPNLVRNYAVTLDGIFKCGQMGPLHFVAHTDVCFVFVE